MNRREIVGKMNGTQSGFLVPVTALESPSISQFVQQQTHLIYQCPSVLELLARQAGGSMLQRCFERRAQLTTLLRVSSLYLNKMHCVLRAGHH